MIATQNPSQFSNDIQKRTGSCYFEDSECWQRIYLMLSIDVRKGHQQTYIRNSNNLLIRVCQTGTLSRWDCMFHAVVKGLP